MKKNIPFSVPILLDEMTIINHEENNVITARAYADVTKDRSFYIFSRMRRDGSIQSVKIPCEVRAIEERERTVKRRKVRERINVTQPWLQKIQHQVSLKEPIKHVVYNLMGKKTTATISINLDYPSEIFIKFRKNITVIAKEHVAYNFIAAFGAGLIADAVLDALDDIFESPPAGFKLEIEIDESGCSLKAEASVDGFY